MAASSELGKPLGLDAVATALSIVEIAVAKMSLAVRGVSVERGFDPRDFVMVGMGGAGPIHAVAIARQLHIPTVIIPVLPSHFSAFGMLMSDIRHDYVRTHLVALPKLELRRTASRSSPRCSSEAEQMLSGRARGRRRHDLPALSRSSLRGPGILDQGAGLRGGDRLSGD